MRIFKVLLASMSVACSLASMQRKCLLNEKAEKDLGHVAAELEKVDPEYVISVFKYATPEARQAQHFKNLAALKKIPARTRHNNHAIADYRPFELEVAKQCAPHMSTLEKTIQEKNQLLETQAASHRQKEEFFHKQLEEVRHNIEEIQKMDKAEQEVTHKQQEQAQQEIIALQQRIQELTQVRPARNNRCYTMTKYLLAFCAGVVISNAYGTEG